MKTLLKKMMVALLALGIGQAAWADDTLNVGEVAQKEMLRMAEAGDAELQFSLGVMYEHGEGVRQDYAEAARWYRKAAEQGLVDAQYNVGVMYEQGQGVRQDYVQAVRWYRKAAEQGHAGAQNNLSVMYSGLNLNQDKAMKPQTVQIVRQGEATLYWFKVNPLYYKGQGVRQDDAEAVRWYLKAVEQEFPEAMRWYRKAVEQEFPPVQKK